MSRLTKTIRENIRKAAVTAAFMDKEAALEEAEHALGMECYRATILETEREAAARMPEGWVRKDACLRFNANGWTARLTVNDPVPVPYQGGICTPLGSLSSDLAERVQAHLTTGRVRPVDHIFSRPGSPPMMERPVFSSRRGDHGEGPAAGGGMGGLDRRVA